MEDTVTVGAGTTTYGVITEMDNGYHVVALDDGEPIEYHWIARVSELPGLVTCGRTADEAIAAARDVLPEFIQFLCEDGCSVPAPNAHLGHAVWDHLAAYTCQQETKTD